ncbi:glucosamine-6-phosphate deaminase [Fodinicola feengrottensis]|uniref:Glucosamine-6-phosphate deaminase n=1 Tax=Fodinicola feengrottensis TaxID=435914 RepID=A0ABN2HSJ5_9ACTN
MKSLRIFDTPTEVAGAVADRLAEVLAQHPRPVITFPTGSTMLPVYREIVARSQTGQLDLRGVQGIQLDEYAGVDDHTEASFRAWLHEHLLAPTGITAFHTLPAHDPTPAALASYEQVIASYGGVDLAILGIGGNGHIAFNEPGSPADSRTRVVELDRRTRQANERYWTDSDAFVPTRAVTQGIGTILEAREVLLIATGAEKAEILHEALHGPVSEHVPASLIRSHPHAEVLADAAAGRQPSDSSARESDRLSA